MRFICKIGILQPPISSWHSINRKKLKWEQNNKLKRLKPQNALRFQNAKPMPGSCQTQRGSLLTHAWVRRDPGVGQVRPKRGSRRTHAWVRQDPKHCGSSLKPSRCPRYAVTHGGRDSSSANIFIFGQTQLENTEKRKPNIKNRF